MKNLWIKEVFKYDGTQLKSLYAYLNHGVLGDSIVSWQGACDVSVEHMVDGEDLIAQEKICGSHMLHFIVEIFQTNLLSAVSLQRLLAAQIKDILEKESGLKLTREGDDLYYLQRKLSISIASSTPVSQMIHFAMNISNEGTPVATASLEDLKINVQKTSELIMQKFTQEYVSIKEATQKVRPLA